MGWVCIENGLWIELDGLICRNPCKHGQRMLNGDDDDDDYYLVATKCYCSNNGMQLTQKSACKWHLTD